MKLFSYSITNKYLEHPNIKKRKFKFYTHLTETSHKPSKTVIISRYVFSMNVQ